MTDRDRMRQTATGLVLAALILASWLFFHVYSIFFHSLGSMSGLLIAIPLVLAICWLNVGLFIVAHDGMHGSLAPGHAGLNRWIGRIALALYAGFSFDRLLPKHFEHHRLPGTAGDPDFSVDHPRRFWPWYMRFIRQYFTMREFLLLMAILAAYIFFLGARPERLLLFWALPAVLSSMQLFLFGTFLPHRTSGAPFTDRHNARSNDFGWLGSLLTCFHFGYHHEHHRAPGVPWWRLPSERFRKATPPQ